LVEKARKSGIHFDYIASGHYAKVGYKEDIYKDELNGRKTIPATRLGKCPGGIYPYCYGFQPENVMSGLEKGNEGNSSETKIVTNDNIKPWPHRRNGTCIITSTL
jgi:hypothetical protein